LVGFFGIDQIANLLDADTRIVPRHPADSVAEKKPKRALARAS
jgi:hypothetical protein